MKTYKQYRNCRAKKRAYETQKGNEATKKIGRKLKGKLNRQTCCYHTTNVRSDLVILQTTIKLNKP